MAILTQQRIWEWNKDNGGDEIAERAFMPTGAKGSQSPEAAKYTYHSPSQVYSPPGGDTPLLTDQFHQSGEVKRGLGGEQLTGNHGNTVYGPDNFARLGSNHNTLLTSLAKLNAGQATLSTANYAAHDYFDTRQPRALRSYFEDKGSSDIDNQRGYDDAHLYPERAVTTDAGETVAVPVAHVVTGLRRWLTNTPGDPGVQGTDSTLDPAFEIDGFEYGSRSEAVEMLDLLEKIERLNAAGVSVNFTAADREEMSALRTALADSDGE